MEHGITAIITRLVFQLFVIILLAKVIAEVFERYLKQPGVLGELAAGMAIGPYALGGIISIPVIGALFGGVEGGGVSNIPVSTELYAIAQIAAIILLFVAGLETDLDQFIRYGGGAAIVAVGGVIVPFFFGAWATVLFGLAHSFKDPLAMFMGAIMTATSVGITARVLTDIGKLDTPEGVTILGGAVIDDVLGILVLAIVVSMGQSGAFSLSKLAIIGVKAVGFWLGLTIVGILLSKKISRFLVSFRTGGATVALALAVAFFASALAQMFGLAMIIGAYSIGLALSDSPVAETLVEKLAPVYHALVPVFFVVMGMLVDFRAMSHHLLFALVITGLAIVGKIFGCGIPALGVGFNGRGAMRVGIGMLPRGEVALIVAGVGLAAGVIKSDIFGVAIMMTLVTTILAPIFLVPAFLKGGEGKRKKAEARAPAG